MKNSSSLKTLAQQPERCTWEHLNVFLGSVIANFHVSHWVKILPGNIFWLDTSKAASDRALYPSMCTKKAVCKSSDRQAPPRYQLNNSIGDLLRNYGEDYIRIHKPPLHHIKLIRASRVCRSPALGGKRVICKGCRHTKYIYICCGHSQCPLCQNLNRELWQKKLSEKFLAVPYIHAVFTISHELIP